MSIALQNEIIIYSTPTCKYCDQAKEWLKSRDFPYTEKDATNPDIKSEMVDLTGQMGVPVIRIGDDVMVGWKEDTIKSILKIE